MTTQDARSVTTNHSLSDPYRPTPKAASGRKIPDPYEIAALTGFLGAAAGLVAAVVGVMNRGGWGFLTSGAYLGVVVGCLLGAGALSWWASTWTDGGWKVLAWTGMAASIGALAVVVIIAAAAMLRDHWPRLARRMLTRRRRGRGVARVVLQVIRSILRS